MTNVLWDVYNSGVGNIDPLGRMVDKFMVQRVAGIPNTEVNAKRDKASAAEEEARYDAAKQTRMAQIAEMSAKPTMSMKKGGVVRGDGCASRGKTKGRMR